MSRITRALISVSDKNGIVEFAQGLSDMRVNILSTGGTAQLLRANGILCRDVSNYTGFPEMLGGRLKTLHPAIHGGILHRRNDEDHVRTIEKRGMLPIDLVVVNLYPFEQTIAKPGCTLDMAIEDIDIGGPTMLRSAAKNWRDVGGVVDPADYPRVLEELQANAGCLSDKTRYNLAEKIFNHTCNYDAEIARYLFMNKPS